MATVGLGAGLQGFLQGAMDFTKIYMAFQQMQNEKEYKDRLFGLQQQEFDLNKSIKEEQLARERSKFEQELNNKNLTKGLFTDKVVRNLNGAPGLHEVENTHTPLTTGNEALDQLIVQTGDLDEAKKLAAVLPAKDKDSFSVTKLGEGIDENGNKNIMVYIWNKNNGKGKVEVVTPGKDGQWVVAQQKNKNENSPLKLAKKYTEQANTGLKMLQKYIGDVEGGILSLNSKETQKSILEQLNNIPDPKERARYLRIFEDTVGFLEAANTIFKESSQEYLGIPIGDSYWDNILGAANGNK